MFFENRIKYYLLFLVVVVIGCDKGKLSGGYRLFKENPDSYSLLSPDGVHIIGSAQTPEGSIIACVPQQKTYRIKTQNDFVFILDPEKGVLTQVAPTRKAIWNRTNGGFKLKMKISNQKDLDNDQ